MAENDVPIMRVETLTSKHPEVFSPEEFTTLQTSISAMQTDVRLAYQDAVDASHHGHPVLVQSIPSDGPGRPRIQIDPDFLRWAYGHRSTASIAQFLGVGRSTVRNAVLAEGIPDLPLPESEEFPPDIRNLAQPTSFTGPVSDIFDDELDMLLLRLRTHYKRAGLSMLGGMLRRLGHRVPTQRVRESLLRIDPVRRIFERIRIRRRNYRVLGPNSLWHHDGQHGFDWGSLLPPFV
ncbi:hypothetical protein R3P38DRAFT_3445779 [Favolaschia claudopus]|uniref:Uncharacterized protein n=1 Tax=Favolaschia claudopus TaxID=2862362 RepID=A0AAV9ZNN0_9AGAR